MNEIKRIVEEMEKEDFDNGYDDYPDRNSIKISVPFQSENGFTRQTPVGDGRYLTVEVTPLEDEKEMKMTMSLSSKEGRSGVYSTSFKYDRNCSHDEIRERIKDELYELSSEMERNELDGYLIHIVDE